MLIDIARLRKYATNLRDEFDGHTHGFGVDVLRILDAFEAMQEHNWMIHRNNTETATGDVVECWDVVASDGTCLAELGNPISSLLAAAQTLEDKSDA